MQVDTGLICGEMTEPKNIQPLEALNNAFNLYQIANNVFQSSLTDPNALKLFMKVIPPANS